MADNWDQFPKAEAPKSEWDAFPAIGNAPVAITPGEKQFAEDRAKIEAAQGVVPESVKTGLYSAANTALFNIPSHVVAAGSYLAGDKPYSEVYKAQKDYEAALERQNPTASAVGTGAGVVGGLLLPGGAIGVGLRGAKAVGAGAALSGGLSGVSTAIEKAPEVIEGDKKAWKEVAINTGIGGVLGGAMAPIAGKIADKFAKMPEVVTTVTDDAGNVVQKFTPEAETAIKRAFGDRLSAEELASFQDDIVKSMQQKGISAAAAREALLTKEGIEPSASLATGLRAQPGGLDVATEARQAAADKLQSKAAGMYDPNVSPFAGAEALQEAERKAISDVKQQYKGLETRPGEFTEGVRWTPSKYGVEQYSVADLVFPEINNILRQEGKVINFQQLESYPKSSDAMKLLRDTVVSGQMPYGGKEDLRNMFKVYEQMNKLQGKAQGDDFATLGVIKNGYTNALDRAIEEGLFVGGDGAKAMADFAAANKQWGQYINDFYAKRGGEARIFNSIINKMVDPRTGFVADELTPEMAQMAQTVINSGLLNKGSGPALYDRLERVIGRDNPAMDAFRAQIRNNIVQIPENGLKGLPAQIDEYLSPALRPVTERAFGAIEGNEKSIKDARDQLLGLRRLSESVKIINETPKVSPADKESMFRRAFSYFLPSLGGAAAGAIHGPFGAVAGSLVAQGAAEIPRALTSRGQLKAEQFGAPLVRPEGVIDPRAYQVFRNYPAMQSPTYQSGYEEPRPLSPLPRQGRKSGGRVGAMTAEGLMAALEKAKREVSGETKVLLNSSDETVARALEIANQHIEG